MREQGKRWVMEVMERLHGDVLVLMISGKVSYYSRKIFQAVIKNAGTSGARTIIIDLSGVRWMDSAGLGLLVLGYLECERRQISLSVVGPQPSIKRLLEDANVASLLPVFATDEQALHYHKMAQV